MSKNKRHVRNPSDTEELDELEELENENEEQETEPEELDETGEQPLAAEPWIEEKVDVEDAPTAFIQSQWAEDDDFPLSDETVSDNIVVGTDPDSVMDEIEQQTLDIEVQEDFEERQNMATDPESLEEELEQYTHQSPKLSGGDVDAAWEDTDQVGEESAGASVATPDQDRVDELGEALGITYDDDEELDTAEKLGERDLNRWELEPASVRDTENSNRISRREDPLQLVDEAEEEDSDELEDELGGAEVDPLELEDEDYDEFEDEDLDLFDDDEMDDEDLL